MGLIIVFIVLLSSVLVFNSFPDMLLHIQGKVGKLYLLTQMAALHSFRELGEAIAWVSWIVIDG